ncbi:Alpha/Beta hydrolase protein [Rhexocercosporidium sp. MPI-PUGE-AT-0058]|nr:Alpha/Beta hydrolase protein [Rhexocercosporidium sp. MPI-PUGE-AT-0058]
MATHPEPYVKFPTARHKTTLIVLHGTSQTGPGFAQSFLTTRFSPPCASLIDPSVTQAAREEVTFPDLFPNCKFVFPTGTPKKTTVFDGRETNAWFDITDFGDRTKGEMEMIEGMRESSLHLADLIRSEIGLLDGDKKREAKLILAGFSQGAAMGLMLLLSGELHRRGFVHGLGGFIGLSGWLPFRRQIKEAISRKHAGQPGEVSTGSDTTTKRGRTMAYVRELLGFESVDDLWSHDLNPLDLPVFLGHGELDVKVRLQWGLQMKDTLEELGVNVDFKSYASLEHWWSDEEVKDVADYLSSEWYGTFEEALG